MNLDEIKQTDRLRGMIDSARRSLPELRRYAETIEPLDKGRNGRFLQRAKDRLDWRRLPGLRQTAPKPENMIGGLLRQFGFFVLLPTALVGLYLFVFASNQYIAVSQFAVRGNVEPMENVQLGEYSNLIQKHNSQDSFVVRDYINSHSIVATVEKSLNFSAMFSRDEADFWARYRGPQPLEELTEYWRHHVSARIDAVSGIITLSVRAFTPEDALTISKEVIRLTEALINDISRRAQRDLVAHAQTDAVAAQERLRNAHLALQSYRNHWGIIDPLKTATAMLTTVASLRTVKMKNESDLQVLRGSNLDEKARSIQTLIANIAAVDQQIKRLEDQLTTEGLKTDAASTNMTQALMEFEGLQVERTISEKLNESANFMLDKARIGASKQQVYLATFVPPALPVDSLYPKRGYGLIITFFCCIVLWSSIALIIAGIKDQRL